VWANPAYSLISSADFSGISTVYAYPVFENRLGWVQVQKEKKKVMKHSILFGEAT